MPPYINVKPLRQMHSDIIVNGADGYRETLPALDTLLLYPSTRL